MSFLTSKRPTPGDLSHEAIITETPYSARATLRAIVMISIGKRQWRDLPAETFARYARATDSDFYLETQLPSTRDFPFPDMPDTPGRKNKIAYASKAYFVFKYLSLGYGQLLIVDDTCLAAADAPDVFRLVPQEHCGFKRTDQNSAAISFQTIREFQDKNREDPIPLKSSHYMNSGFLIYDSSMREAFNPQNIIRAKDLLYCKFPNQSLTYYLIKKSNIKLFHLPEGFNIVPGRRLSSGGRRALRDVRPHLDKGYVYHVTSHFAHRRKIIRQIYDHFAQDGTFDQAPSAGPLAPEVFAMRREISALKAQVALAKAREDQARLRLRKIEHSLSWRITRPLRALIRALAILFR